MAENIVKCASGERRIFSVKRATLDDIPVITDFIEEKLDELGCDFKTKNQINVALDEIYGNIVRYAYSGKEGFASVEAIADKENGDIEIIFTDNGIPFNPLEAKATDTALPVEDRPIGGLGIFLVKKLMDSVEYSYRNGQNIFSMKKKINTADK